jgi:NADPH:quinone reductase-like Zn-dependent oxidoreductase
LETDVIPPKAAKYHSRLIRTNHRLFGMMIPKFPAVLGFDGAGIIDAVGADVKDIKVGDEVASHHTAGDRAAAYQV